MGYFKCAASLALLSCAAAPASAAVEAAKPCMTKDQLGGLVVALLPAAMKQLQSTCKVHLPAGASLNNMSPSQIKIFEAAAETAKPKAGEALGIMMGKDIPQGVDPGTMLPFIEAMAVSGLANEMKPENCNIANNLWSALAPLPPENWGELVASFVALGIADNKKADKAGTKKGGIPDMNICPYVAAVKS